MSIHNKNLAPSSHAKCKCGRYATIGEWKARIGIINYTCPDCLYQDNNKLIRTIANTNNKFKY